MDSPQILLVGLLRPPCLTPPLWDHLQPLLLVLLQQIIVEIPQQ